MLASSTPKINDIDWLLMIADSLESPATCIDRYFQKRSLNPAHGNIKRHHQQVKALARAKPNLYYQILNSTASVSKYELIRQTLADAIVSGEYRHGQRLPSESQLVKTFGASRPTVIRALRELQLAGMIERRVGSGSYVRAEAEPRGHTFGLLIPELGRTEIFEPICRGMAEAQHGSQHVLLWGSSLTGDANLEQQAAHACRQLVA